MEKCYLLDYTPGWKSRLPGKKPWLEMILGWNNACVNPKKSSVITHNYNFTNKDFLDCAQETENPEDRQRPIPGVTVLRHKMQASWEPRDAIQFPGLIDSLMYRADYVFKSQANFYLHDESLGNSPDIEFGRLLDRSNCLTSLRLPPLVIVESLRLHRSDDAPG